MAFRGEGPSRPKGLGEEEDEDDRKKRGLGRARGRARGLVPNLQDQEQTPMRQPGQSAIQETSSPESGAGDAVPPPTDHSPEEDPGAGSRTGKRGFERASPILHTKPRAISDKKGVSGQRKRILTNYFELLIKSTSKSFSFFTVSFEPATEELDNEKVKKALLKTREADIGPYLFDGIMLFTVQEIPENKQVLQNVCFPERPGDERPRNVYTVTLSFKRIVHELEPVTFQLYNILLRKCQGLLKLDLLGRHFYDSLQKIAVPAHHLELWPGFITSMRQQETLPMVHVDLTMKVLRTDNVFSLIREYRSNDPNNFRAMCERALSGVIVMTEYNHKTYKVDGIDWNKTAATTFEQGKGANRRNVSFIEYYQARYQRKIQVASQPLLISRPTIKDIRRGDTGDVLLVPELCYQTGLTEAMREDFRLMKDLSQYLHQDPRVRIQQIKRFMDRLAGCPEAKKLMEETWGMKFRTEPVEVPGRELPREPIIFRDLDPVTPNEKADWSAAFRNKQMHTAPQLARWAIIVPQREHQSVQNLVSTMQRVAGPLGYRIDRPEILQINRISGRDYTGAITDVFNKANGKLDMVMAVLANNRLDTYSEIKVKCSVEYGVPSQCILTKTLNNQRGLMSVCTKLVIQMNAKQGGEPWTVRNPLKGLMVVGFDVHHGGGASVGAMTATVSGTLAQYYSTITRCQDRMEISETMGAMLFRCMMAYRKKNDSLPTRIMIYRDGVGDGQLNFVFENELRNIKGMIQRTYKDANTERPKLTYVVVTKRTNTRLFEVKPNTEIVNPAPGTIVDDIITCPERYDFYLIPQTARQGTVAPVNFNILFDDSGLDADKIQRFTYKLCHMYFNWSGTVTVPAPCQYAHKLAFLTGTALQRGVNDRLCYLLHFL